MGTSGQDSLGTPAGSWVNYQGDFTQSSPLFQKLVGLGCFCQGKGLVQVNFKSPLIEQTATVCQELGLV
jgi:hypothetical protein